jgi:acetyltransferase-like isoleucine patch superfamily enzyme
MSGRTLFARGRPIVELIGRFNAVIPSSIFSSTWFLVRDIPGLVGIALRYLWALRLSASCGDNVMIGRGCEIKDWSRLEIGHNVTIHLNTYIDASGGVSIGNDVSIAHNCSVLSFEHGWGDPTIPIKYNPLSTHPVEIANDVWVGCGARILAGSQIGSRTIVAAGAVVVRGVIGGGVYAGVPARLVKAIS